MIMTVCSTSEPMNLMSTDGLSYGIPNSWATPVRPEIYYRKSSIHTCAYCGCTMKVEKFLDLGYCPQCGAPQEDIDYD